MPVNQVIIYGFAWVATYFISRLLWKKGKWTNRDRFLVILVSIVPPVMWFLWLGTFLLTVDWDKPAKW